MKAVVAYVVGLEKHPKMANEFVYAWLEGPMQAKLGYLKNCPDWDEIDIWYSGRVFGPMCEYHWQRISDGGIHAVLILDEGEIPEEFQEARLEIIPYEDKLSNLILWGEWVDPKRDSEENPHSGPLFYAQEIPRIQHYPIPVDKDSLEGKTAQLIIRRYHHKSEGEFIRCVGLEIKAKNDEETGL